MYTLYLDGSGTHGGSPVFIDTSGEDSTRPTA
jgi:hypothetical protein